MSHNALGIDTGGTFTDGVLYDLDTGEILCKSKVVTNRSDLHQAITHCLNELTQEARSRRSAREIFSGIMMTCLSTTLATNAIVEGQGAEVGLLVIGAELDGNLPTVHTAFLAGGCNIQGRIREPVDLEAARGAIERMRQNVETFAVSGYMSVRNPEQELAVRDLVSELTGYPAVCGHQLSGDLGIYERTVTATLNARLIPLIVRLIEAVKQSLTDRGIVAPLMVVKGDGGLISEAVARQRPIETILSGPAASLIGGGVLAGLSDALVVDMGGTTTDVAVLRSGSPVLSDRGAKVGGWQTHIKAAEITTVGLGGDSIIRVSRDRRMEIGPQRVFPLCWSAAEFPHLLGELDAVWQAKFDPLKAQPTCILFFIREPEKAVLKEAERELLDQIRRQPHTLHNLSVRLGKDETMLPWQHLVEIGTVHRANLTPTDLLHAGGQFVRWNREASELGIRIMARRFKASSQRFSEEVQTELRYRLFALLVEKLVASGGRDLPLRSSEHSDYLLRQMFRPGIRTVEFGVKARLPVVAVGAPAGAFFPEVAERLGARLFLAADGDVANAVGTVNGSVTERVKILIKPGESGGFFVYGPAGRKIFIDFEESLAYGEEIGREYALRRAAAAGGHKLEVTVRREDSYSTLDGAGDSSDENRLFIECSLEVSASGRPYSYKEE